MATLFRNRDTWVGVGLVAFIYAGGLFIQWSLKESERLQIEAQEKEKREKVLASQAQRVQQPQFKTEDDIETHDLWTLCQSPEWDIRHAAIDVVLHRFAADRECRKDLQARLEYSLANDTEDIEYLYHLCQLAKNRFHIDLSVDGSYDFRTLAQKAQAASQAQRDWNEVDEGEEVDQGEEAWEDCSPIFGPASGGGMTDEAVDLALADALQPLELTEPQIAEENARQEDNRDMFHELPMENDEGPLGIWPEPSRLGSSGRQQRREAMVLGGDEGLEVFEGGEVTSVGPHASAEELIEHIESEIDVAYQTTVEGLSTTGHGTSTPSQGVRHEDAPAVDDDERMIRNHPAYAEIAQIPDSYERMLARVQLGVELGVYAPPGESPLPEDRENTNRRLGESEAEWVRRISGH